MMKKVLTILFVFLLNAAMGQKYAWLLSATVKPTVTTTSITAITSTTASSGGNVINDGGTPVTSKGVCWGVSSNPTISDSHTSDGTGTGSITSSITGLTAGVTYYVRAYATNGIGTAYGNEVTFTTTNTCLRPDGLTNLYFAYQVSGNNITSQADAEYYAANYNCSPSCKYYEGKTVGSAGSDVYVGFTNTDCTKVSDGWYVMIETSSPFNHWAVQVSGGKLYYVTN